MKHKTAVEIIISISAIILILGVVFTGKYFYDIFTEPTTPYHFNHPPDYIIPREIEKDKDPAFTPENNDLKTIYSFDYGFTDDTIGYFLMPEKWRGEPIEYYHYSSLLFDNKDNYYLFDWYGKCIKYFDRSGKIIKVYRPQNYDSLLVDSRNNDPRSLSDILFETGGNLAPRFDLNFEYIYLTDSKGIYRKFNQASNFLEEVQSEYILAGKRFIRFPDKNECEIIKEKIGLETIKGKLETTDSGSWLSDFDMDQKGAVYTLIYNNESDKFILSRFADKTKITIDEGKLNFAKKNFKAVKIYLVKTDKYFYIIGAGVPDKSKYYRSRGIIACYDAGKKKIIYTLKYDNILIEVFIKNIFTRGDSLITHDME